MTFTDYIPRDSTLRTSRSRCQNRCSSLISHYPKFKTALDDAAFGYSDKAIFIQIGQSKVGKTTNAARLLSKLSPVEFTDALDNNSSDFAVIEGLVIGHGVPSTTVAPTGHLVDDDFFIVDLPGFAENDPDKRVTITIFQKFFLTHVFGLGRDRLRLVCVVDVNSLFEPNCNALLTNYHEALRNLLGEDNYRDVIPSLTFLITKNIHPRRSRQEIVDRIGQVVDDILSMESVEVLMAARLLQRMKTNFEIVDLDVETNKTLAEKLERLQENSSVAESIKEKRFSFERLDVGENELIQNCDDYIHGIMGVLGSSEKAVQQLRKRWKDTATLHEKETEKLCREKRIAVKQRENVRSELQSVQIALDRFLETLRMMESREVDANMSVKNNEEALRVYKKNRKDLPQITVRCDESQEAVEVVPLPTNSTPEEAKRKGKNRFRSWGTPPEVGLSHVEQPRRMLPPSHSVNLRANLMIGAATEHFILVVSGADGKEAIEHHLRSKNPDHPKGSITPRDLTELHDIDGRSIFFKSGRKNSCSATMIDSLDTDGVKEFQIDSFREAFIVLMYSRHAFVDSTFAQMIESHFLAQIEQENTRLEHARAAIIHHKLGNTKHQAEKEKLQKELTAATENIQNVNSNAKAMQSEHEDAASTLMKSLASVQSEIDSIRKDSVLGMVSEVMEIFRENKIDTKVSDRLDRIAKESSDLVHDLEEIKKEINDYQLANKSALMDIMGMASN